MPRSNKPVPYTNHNNLGDIIVLKAESRITFLNLLEAHLQKLQPAGPIEAAIVEEMVANFWRLSCRYTIDVALPDSRADTITAEESTAVENRLLASYESRLRRKYNRSLRTLEMIRSSQPANQAPADHRGRRPSERNRLLKPVSTKYQTEAPTNAKRT